MNLNFYSLSETQPNPVLIRTRVLNRAKSIATHRGHPILLIEELYLYSKGRFTHEGICHTRYFRVNGKWSSPDNSQSCQMSWKEIMRDLSQ